MDFPVPDDACAAECTPAWVDAILVTNDNLKALAVICNMQTSNFPPDVQRKDLKKEERQTNKGVISNTLVRVFFLNSLQDTVPTSDC